PVFILSEDDFALLPPEEHVYFRRVAGTSTIRHGRLFVEKYIFYPYGKDGVTLSTEPDVERAVPTYYQTVLLRNRDALVARRGTDLHDWWLLARPRSWLRMPSPKIVSKAFGRSGGFAYDETGDYVVVQGLAWEWRRKIRRGLDFDQTLLPWAYLSVLNSRITEVLFAVFCPQVQGGQFDLSSRYVYQVPLPDLSDDRLVPLGVVEALADQGRQIHSGTLGDTSQIDALVARLYRIDSEDLQHFQPA
ncbi:MAG: hypothetical protein KKI08_14040, partial [Armatimonadetes bacterium]|nr:hypothetical protein [Armatimonadota bacterium]